MIKLFKYKNIKRENFTSESPKTRSVFGIFSVEKLKKILSFYNSFDVIFQRGKIRREFHKGGNSGFTLAEMVVYIFIMTTVTLVIVQSLIVVLKSNRGSFAEMNLRNAGYSSMEGMLREIYGSNSIDLPTATGSILQMKQNNSSSTVKFATSSSNVLNFYEGSSSSTLVLTGPLTPKNIIVKSLIFTKINTGKSLAIKIQLKLETTVNNITKSEWFYSTGVLRGSY